MSYTQLKLGIESAEAEREANRKALAARALKMEAAAKQLGAQEGEVLYKLSGMLAVFCGSPSAIKMGCTGLQWIGSKKDLADHERLECHVNQVGRALSRLEAAGVITRTTVRNARGQNAGVLIEIQMGIVNMLAKSPQSRAYYLVDDEPKSNAKTILANDVLPLDDVYNAHGSADGNAVYNAHGSADSNIYGNVDSTICDPLFISNKSVIPLSPTTPTTQEKTTSTEQPVVVVDDDNSQGSFEITPEQRRDIETGAKMLAESIRSPQRRRDEREVCWQLACVAVLFEGLHQVRQFLRSAHNARDEADYYRGILRRFAEDRGCKLHELKKQLPPCPQPKIPTTEPVQA